MRTHNCLSQRGVGLLEPMIAIVILCFGLLGLAQFQFNLIAQTTDSQSRLAASALAEELLALLRVDLDNVDCYTFPQTGTCDSTVAKGWTSAWAERAAKQVPGFLRAIASQPDANTFQVTLTWTGKAFKETRVLEVTTDVRP